MGLWVALAVPVATTLWASLDALRIELRPGRAQPVAILAQFFGALVAARLTASLLNESKYTLAFAIAIALLLVAGLAALLLLRVPEAPRDLVAADSGRAENDAPFFSAFWRGLTRPWAAFFRRFGVAAAPMLGAVALYALAGSWIEHLATLGHVQEVSPVTRGDENARILDFFTLAKPAEDVLTLLGGIVAAWTALRVSPFRAFFRLNCVLAVFALIYIGLKVADGFTPATVAALYVAKTMLMGAEYLMYATAAAALTSRPHTAGQYVLISFFVAVFWLPTGNNNSLNGATNSYFLPVLALAAALGAIALLLWAARAARRPQEPAAAAQPSS